jgi:site-specific DNA recombinase
MTLVTGKSGRYRYYKCTTRQSQGNHACASKNLPMEKLDELILSYVTERILTPERLRLLLAELRKRMKSAKERSGQTVKALEKQLKGIEGRLARLYDAIAVGTLDINDETLKEFVHKLKASKESTLLELASAKGKQHAPVTRIVPTNVDAFSRALRKRLEDKRPEFAKRYLNILVDEIVIDGDEASIRGSYDRLAVAVQKSKESGLDQVPSFMGKWRARQDSNL